MDNGWILFARQTLDSEIWLYKPTEWFKIWMYILVEVNHTDNKHFKRGTNFFRWSIADIRCPGITQYQWQGCLEWLREAGQITTQKTTRGIVISVVNYGKYQNIKKSQPKWKPTQEPEQNPNRTEMINNNVTMEQVNTIHTQAEKFFENPEPVIQSLLAKGYPENHIRQEIKKFVSYWTEPNKFGKPKWKLKETFEIQRRLSTWFNNIKTTPQKGERKIWKQPLVKT